MLIIKENMPASKILIIGLVIATVLMIYATHNKSKEQQTNMAMNAVKANMDVDPNLTRVEPVGDHAYIVDDPYPLDREGIIPQMSDRRDALNRQPNI